MLVIRLKPMGTKHFRSYRIIVIEKLKSRDSGKILENIGFYIPTVDFCNNTYLAFNSVRLSYWVLRGAQIKKSKSHSVVHMAISFVINSHFK